MPEILPSIENRYKGRWIEGELIHDAEKFRQDLAYSLSAWQTEGTKVIWLSIPSSRALLINSAIDMGFDFHHTKNDQLVLTKRLVDNAIVPEFANHTIGVGGIVLNEHNEILTIVEKHDMVERPGHFKFPGGMMDAGEFVREAVVREVFEETGITAKCNGVVGLRHYHQGQFGTSNFYIVCHLTALSETITPCPEEIGKALWMPTQDYLACETVLDFNKKMLHAALGGQYFNEITLENFTDLSPEEYEIFVAQS